MPLGEILGGALVGGATNLLGNIWQNRKNQQLAESQRKFDVKMWNMQNAYNDPSAQMERLQKAGLNPNLVYGSGSVAGNVTSSPPKSSVPHMENPLAGTERIPMQVLSMYNDIRMKDAQVDNVQANTELANRKASTETVNALLKTHLASGAEKKLKTYDYSNVILGSKAQWASETAYKNLENLRMGVNLRKQQLKLNPQAMKLNALNLLQKQLDYDLNRKLRPAGLDSNSPWYAKMLMNTIYDWNPKTNSNQNAYERNDNNQGHNPLIPAQ